MTLLTISEQDGIYGPVIQGEGPDLGKPCFFLRLQHCPVQCPGCDTHYTWDGTEKGTPMDLDEIGRALTENHIRFPNAGLVVSGGEPLIHFRNPEVRRFMHRATEMFPWSALETSGFVGRTPIKGNDTRDLADFLRAFTRICCSPKITPCLHGQWSDEELLANMEALMLCAPPDYNTEEGDFTTKNPHHNLFFKFVVRDGADVLAVMRVDAQFGLSLRKFYPIYLMPFGQTADEVIAACRDLVPHVAKTGYILTPRLHSIMYGKKRGI